MKQKQTENCDFFFDYETNLEGRLLNLLWCDEARISEIRFIDFVPAEVLGGEGSGGMKVKGCSSLRGGGGELGTLKT